VKNVIDLIINLRNQIIEKRTKLNNINIENEGKIHLFFAQNKNIELELKENLKKYKELTTKRSMLKKQMKQLENKKYHFFKYKK